LRANCVQIFSLLHSAKGPFMITSSIKASLDTRRSKKDGTYPLILRLTHNRKTTSIKTGIYLRKEDWDAKKLEVKKSYKGTSNITRLNNEIQKKKSDGLDSILKLSEGKKVVPSTVADVKQRIDPGFQNRSFYDFGDGLIKELIKAERVGTARSYQLVINVLKTFNKGKPFEKTKVVIRKRQNSKSQNVLILDLERSITAFYSNLKTTISLRETN